MVLSIPRKIRERAQSYQLKALTVSTQSNWRTNLQASVRLEMQVFPDEPHVENNSRLG